MNIKSIIFLEVKWSSKLYVLQFSIVGIQSSIYKNIRSTGFWPDAEYFNWYLELDEIFTT